MALFRYKNSNNWWYEFQFAGQRIRESTKTSSRKLAAEAERVRRRQMEEGFNGVKKREKARLFVVAAEDWLAMKSLTLATSSIRIERHNLKHLLPRFGRQLVTDIEAHRCECLPDSSPASRGFPKNCQSRDWHLRAILRRNRRWSEIQMDVRMLPTRDDIGHALTLQEEERLLAACTISRSRLLHPAVVLALSSAMRYSEIRLLTWGQIDLNSAALTVGKSKTAAGTDRVIPLNARALAALNALAVQFPDRCDKHYVFPSEKYGGFGDEFKAGFYDTDPRRPVGDWKEAWEAAKRRAKVHADSMTYATPLARECSRAEFPILSLPASWAGVRQPRSECQKDMVTSDRMLTC